MVAVRLLHWLEDALGWESTFNPDTMRAVLGTLAGGDVHVHRFCLFVAAAGRSARQRPAHAAHHRHLVPRPVTKFTLALFVFTFTFALAALVRIGTTVPLLTDADRRLWLRARVSACFST